MCLFPHEITNNRGLYRHGIDKMFLTVPCGKCVECRQQRVNDWYVRLNYEFQHYNKPCIKNGKAMSKGMVIFATFTYNEESIPYLDTTSSSFDSLDIFNNVVNDKLKLQETLQDGLVDLWNDYTENHSVWGLPHFTDYMNKQELEIRSKQGKVNVSRGFNRDHVRNMVKKLRTYLTRDGYLSKEEITDGVKNDNLKYFCVCEFGGEKERPHYHVIFFLPFLINPETFRTNYLSRSWSLEFKPDTTIDKTYRDGSTLVVKNELAVPQEILDYASKHNEEMLWTKNKSGRLVPGKVLDLVEWLIYIPKNRKKPIFLHRLGLVQYSDKYPPVISDPKGMLYLLKYLHKDSQFMSLQFVKDLDRYQKCLPSLNNLGGKVLDRVKQIRDFFPFVLSSNNIGQDLFNELNVDISQLDEQETQKVIDKINSPLTFSNDTYRYKVPQYIINRLFYNNVSLPDKQTPFRFLTPLGQACLQLRFDNQVKSMSKLYQLYTDSNTLALLSSTVTSVLNPMDKHYKDYNLMSDDQREVIYYQEYILNGSFNFEHKFKHNYYQIFNQTITHDINQIRRQLSQFYINFEFLAIYRLVFQNVAINHLKQISHETKNFNFNDPQDLRKLAYHLISAKTDSHNYYSRQSQRLSDLGQEHLNSMYNHTVLFNDLPIFKGFDLILQKLDFIRKELSQPLKDNQHTKDEINLATRKIYNQLKFT